MSEEKELQDPSRCDFHGWHSGNRCYHCAYEAQEKLVNDIGEKLTNALDALEGCWCQFSDTVYKNKHDSKVWSRNACGMYDLENAQDILQLHKRIDHQGLTRHERGIL